MSTVSFTAAASQALGIFKNALKCEQRTDPGSNTGLERARDPALLPTPTPPPIGKQGPL